MSLVGLVRHMADVERNWFRRVMAQADAAPLYWSEDVPDADWLGAAADPAVVEDAWRAWRGEVAFADKFVADSPDLGVKGAYRDGQAGDQRTTARCRQRSRHEQRRLVHHSHCLAGSHIPSSPQAGAKIQDDRPLASVSSGGSL
jgi:hypothetical protein